MQTKNDFCLDGHCCTGDFHAPVHTVILSVNFMFGTQTPQLSLNCIITPAIKGHINCNKGWKNHNELYCYRNLQYHTTLHTQMLF